MAKTSVHGQLSNLTYVEQFRLQYLFKIYGISNVKQQTDPNGKFIGIYLDEELTVEAKETRFDTIWRLIFDDVEVSDDIINIIDAINIPRWYDLDDWQSIPQMSELPFFSLDDFNDDDFENQKIEMKSKRKERILKIRNDHRKSGYVEQDLLTYLQHRGANELNPKFVTNYHEMIYVLKTLYIKTFGVVPQSLQYLKAWMNKFGFKNGKYVNIIRISEGKIIMWSTDSHFLKRITVVINSMINALFQTLYIDIYPNYLHVLDEISSFLFLDLINGIRKIKKINGSLAMLVATISRDDDSFGHLQLDELLNITDYLNYSVHQHPYYDFVAGEVDLQTSFTYTQMYECTSCKDYPLRDAMFRMRSPVIRATFALIKELNMKYFPEFCRLLLRDFMNELNALNLCAFSMLLSLAGFTETGKIADIIKTYDEAREHTDAELSVVLPQDSSKYQIRERFKSGMRTAYRNIAVQSINKGMYPSANDFKSSLMSMVTGKSAGVGSFTLTFAGDTLSSYLAKDTKITFSDKRFIAILTGSSIFNFITVGNVKRDITETYQSWLARFEVAHQYTGTLVDDVINPLTWSKSPGPLSQSNIGVRVVPGGRASRAIYVQPLKYYLMERALFNYVELFKYNRNLKYVSSNFINEVDHGNFNIKFRMDNTEDFLAPLIMCSTRNDFAFYAIDFTQFDMSETFDGVRCAKYDGVMDAFNQFPYFETLNEPYFLLDSRPINLKELLSFAKARARNMYYFIREGVALRELRVNWLTSGSYETFDDNSINNSEMTRIVEDITARKYGFGKFHFVTIAGDDNAGAIPISNAGSSITNDNFIKLSDEINTIPTYGGFKVNKDKSITGQGVFEMAKIAALRGYVVRLGNTQLLESEKSSQAETLVSILRGLASKFFMFSQRYPVKFDVFQLVQQAIMGFAYRIDLTGKRDIYNVRKRSWFYPNLGTMYVNADVNGGIGATFSGQSTGEQVFIYYCPEFREEMMLWNYVARNIKFIIDDQVRDQIADTILNYANQNVDKFDDSKFEIRDPTGLLIQRPFTHARTIFSLSDNHKHTSSIAREYLRKHHVVLPDNVFYENFKDVAMRDSINSALSTVKTVRIDKRKDLEHLFLQVYNYESELINFKKRYPLVMGYDVEIQLDVQGFKNMKHKRMQRYCTCMDSTNFAFKFFGLRHTRLSYNVSGVLYAYTRILQAARRANSYNSSITEESLRDIIHDAVLKAKSNVAIDEVIRNVILAIFGNLHNVADLVDGVLRSGWTHESSQLGYSISGSNLVYCDLLDSNTDRFTAINVVGSHRKYVKQLALSIALGASALYLHPVKIRVVNLIEHYMSSTSTYTQLIGVHGSSDTDVLFAGDKVA